MKDPKSFPEFLYRYRSNDTVYAIEEIKKAVLHNRLFLSRADALNDPFEAKPKYVESTVRELVKADGIVRKDKKASVPRHIRFKKEQSFAPQILADFVKRVRIGCLSEDGHNFPMWAHYANNHKGYCLKYRLEIGLAFPYTPFPHNIDYDNKRPVVSTIDLAKFAGELGNSKIDPEFNMKLLRKIFYRKAFQWEYEKEWRICEHIGSHNCPDPTTDSYWEVKVLQPEAIIFGASATDEFKRKVTEAVNGRVQLLKAVPSSSVFEMEFIPLKSV